jgi:hypothetical protein
MQSRYVRLLIAFLIFFASFACGLFAQNPKSVTEFHDNFESGTSQWILNNGWGLDGMYRYSGSYSLSESPNDIYSSNLDLLPQGGSVGQIASTLDFSGTPNAEMNFWFRYEIESIFDRLSVQASIDGINWTTLNSWDGSVTTWYLETVSLGGLAGQSTVHIRFLFASDPGLELIGSNIDELNIIPLSNDNTPPLVFYSKDEDYFDSNPDGFEIRTQITDYSGIDFANVLYKVNNGTEITLPPQEINGSEFYYIIPEQTSGSYVEFRFYCSDNAAIPNQSYTGPFFYTAGLHHVYDTPQSFAMNSIKSDPVLEGDVEEISVKFTIYKDDIVGAVISGYTVGSVNATMLIQVYTDNNGLPGTPLLPSPVSFINPATQADPDKWGYLDLSSYSQLRNLEGNYHIGISSDTDGDSGTTYYTTCYNEGNTRACVKLVPEGGGNTLWYIDYDFGYYIRAVTTNNKIAPGTISPDPVEITQSIQLNSISGSQLAVNNIGSGELNYSATFEYDGNLHEGYSFYSEDYNTALNWTPSGELVWYRDTGTSNLDGTPFARVDALTSGGSITKYGVLTSGIIDASAYETLQVEFDMYRSLSTGSYALEASNDGIVWTPVFSATGALGAWNSPYHRTVSLPDTYRTNSLRLRFNVGLPKNGGLYAVDNISVKGTVPYSWLTLDGGLTISGIVPVSGSDNILVGYNSAGLAEGTYSATVYLNSLFSNVSVPLTLTVTSVILTPGVPSNIVTSLSGSDLLITWDVSANTTGYDIYSSSDPYTEFTFIQTVTTTQFTIPADQSRKFFYIVAKN